MKKTLLLLSLISFSTIINAQVKVNQNAANSAINTSSAFMDASSSPLWNGTTNQGKGMLYPRVDLVNYTAMSHAGPFNASNNPNYFDGLLVFNTTTGVAGIGADSVFPGYYYYRNTTTTANGGHWVSLKGINGATGAVGPIGLTGVAGTNGLNALVNTTTEAAGANCVNGGTKVEYGLDDNNNGILDLVEVEAALTKYVCNGLNGSNSNGVSLSGVQFFLTAGTFTWTVPAGISKVWIKVVGGGGGGGSSTSGRYGGGGGGGAYAEGFLSVTPSTVATVTVGGGGGGGSSSGGATGGASNFNGLTIAGGGIGGTRGYPTNGLGGAGGISSGSGTFINGAGGENGGINASGGGGLNPFSLIYPTQNASSRIDLYGDGGDGGAGGVSSGSSGRSGFVIIYY